MLAAESWVLPIVTPPHLKGGGPGFDGTSELTLDMSKDVVSWNPGALTVYSNWVRGIPM